MLFRSKHANNLGNYAVFLDNVRKDPDRAEEFYKRAAEADPKHAHHLGSYAVFLDNVRKDPDRAEQFFKRAVEADPDRANNLGNYAVFLADVRKDPGRAEEFYERAVEADPKHASNLGNYAVFLVNVRKDPGRAEEFFKRAVEADPKHANNLGNYAGLLLAQGKADAGRTLLERCLAVRSQDTKDALAVELAFYAYAHGAKDDRKKWLTRLKQLLGADIKSLGWNLEANVQRALRDKHPAKSWLKKLAAVITEGADIASLNHWKEWERLDETHEQDTGQP